VKSKVWLAVLCVLFALCVALSALLMLPGEAARYAEVRAGGELVATLDLTQERVLTVETELGTNVVTVKDGKVAVTEADCPDHYCMERGFCDSGAMIVCLPNKLTIRFLGEQEIDAAVG